MSVETWMAEYYPTPADSPKLNTDEKRILHALKKFKGARPEALKKHGVRFVRSGFLIAGIDRSIFFEFDGASCALCFQYLDYEHNDCSKCPLAEQGDMCDSEGEKDPFSIFYQTNNPEPMIKSLKKALERVKSTP